MHKIYEAAAEGSSSWTLGEYAVSIRSDLRSTASLPPHHVRKKWRCAPYLSKV